MFVSPIGLEVVLSILHVSDNSFDVDKFIINPMMKDLLIQVEMVHELSNVSKVVLHRPDLMWCHVKIK
jgi:hypothetical protein